MKHGPARKTRIAAMLRIAGGPGERRNDQHELPKLRRSKATAYREGAPHPFVIRASSFVIRHSSSPPLPPLLCDLARSRPRDKTPPPPPPTVAASQVQIRLCSNPHRKRGPTSAEGRNTKHQAFCQTQDSHGAENPGGSRHTVWPKRRLLSPRRVFAPCEPKEKSDRGVQLNRRCR